MQRYCERSTGVEWGSDPKQGSSLCTLGVKLGKGKTWEDQRYQTHRLQIDAVWTFYLDQCVPDVSSEVSLCLTCFEGNKSTLLVLFGVSYPSDFQVCHLRKH